MNKLLNGLLLGLLAFSTLQASEKIYIDDEALDSRQECFHIHTGHNVWLETNTVHRDDSGLYIFETDLIRAKNGHRTEHQKKWKCPYCYQYWPIGQACQNKDCPSKYK